MSERPSVWGELPPHGTVLTTAEYLQTAESMRVQELIYGTLRVEDSPHFRHQNLLLELAVLMRVFVGQHKLGVVCIAPQDVILDPARALILQPDLMFISKAPPGDHQRSHLGRARPGGRSDVAASADRQARRAHRLLRPIRRQGMLAGSPAARVRSKCCALQEHRRRHSRRIVPRLSRPIESARAARIPHLAGSAGRLVASGAG